MRTLIYARYSSQLQNSRSIDQQVEVCHERAAREGWTVVDVFADYAIGGGAGTNEAQRPGLAAMLTRVEQGDIEQILVDTTSRIARNQGDSHHIRDRLNYWGARLFTLGDGEIDRFKGAIKGLLDEQQRVELRHNIKRGQRDTVAQGRSPAGIAYGYRTANRIDPNGRPVRGLREIDDDQAEIVRRIFRDYAAGVSPVAIAQRLNAEGIPGPRGDRWRATTIRPDRTRGNGMLQNQLYIGRIIHNRTSKIIEPVTRTVRIRPNPPEQWVIEDVPHLRILDQGLWEEVQAGLRRLEGSVPHKARRAKHLLSGLGVCGECGSPYIVRSRTYWGCSGRREGNNCSNNRTVANTDYETRVLEGLQRHMLDPRLVAIWVKEFHEERTRRTADLKRERRDLEKKAAESSAKITRLVDAISGGAGEFQEIREALTKARADRDVAASQLAELEALPVITLHPAIAEDYRRQVKELTAAVADPAARDGAMPAIRQLIDRIVLRPAKGERGIDIEVEGRLAAIVALATGKKLETPSTAKVERVAGIEPA
ncbi:recombinase family protein [Novosphingobium sp. AP12]|uniref:recombinase family protein n=1 Tax=Novosphingobium sp. AP12 TaxID=1144305 RepID=UPI0009DB46DA|nr:recombinase family protein [Novosphingobium sp. AP12]